MHIVRIITLLLAVFAATITITNGQSTSKNIKQLLKEGDKYLMEEAYELAAAAYEQGAALGNPEAMAKLGACYYEGLGVEVNQLKSYELIHQAARLNDPIAFVWLGAQYRYMGERELAEDYFQRAKTFQSTLKKDPIGQSALAYIYDVEGDMDKLYYWLERAAKYKYRPAMVRLAICLVYGDGVAKDAYKGLSLLHEFETDQYAKTSLCFLGQLYQDPVNPFYDRKKALSYYEQSIAQNNTMAMCSAAYMYQDSFYQSPDYEKAANCFRRASDNGSSHGALGIARLHDDGLLEYSSIDSALYYYHQAAGAGFMGANYYIAGIFHRNDTANQYFDTILHYLEPLATRDYTFGAQELISFVYWRNGYPEEAIKWMEKATKGLVVANYHLGRFYNIMDDAEKSFYWYKQAAMLGLVKAQNIVGVYYLSGIGTEKDYEKAVFWFKKAVAKGDIGGYYNLGYAYEAGLGVEQDYKKAAKFYQQVLNIDSSFIQATYRLGGLYLFGNGVSKDEQRGVKMIYQAARAGVADAQLSMGYLHLEGTGVEQNEELAIRWFELAAQQGNEEAMALLGT